MTVADIRETPPRSGNVSPGSSTLPSYGAGVDKVSDFANLNALPRIEGNIYYADDQDSFYVDDGTTLQKIFSGPKQVWFDVGDKTGEMDGYSLHDLGSNGAAFFSFKIPDDFVALVELVVVQFPASTRVGANIDFLSVYAALGEDRLTHQESDVTTTYNYTAGEITYMDVSGVFTGIQAGDICGLEMDNNGGGNICVLGIKMRYL